MHYGEMQENRTLEERFKQWLSERRRVGWRSDAAAAPGYRHDPDCANCGQPRVREHDFRRVVVFVLAVAVVFGAVPETRAGVAPVVITEVAAFEKGDHEWVEVLNRSEAPVDLSGWKFIEDGTNHALTLSRGESSALAPGEYAVIADVAANFISDYSAFAGKVFDSSWSSLREEGEEIGLRDSDGAVIELFTYLPGPDGSVERLDVAGDDYRDSNWQARSAGATPGVGYEASAAGESLTADPALVSAPTTTVAVVPPSSTVAPVVFFDAPPAFSKVVISELYPNPPGGDEAEWIEIANLGTLAQRLSNWALTDGVTRYEFDDRSIAPREYIVLPRRATGIALDNNEDAVRLFDEDGHEVDRADYDDAVEEGTSIALGESGTFMVTARPTPTAPNDFVQPNRPPVISLTPPRDVVPGRLVLFDATDTADPDGDPLTFHYAFDDGTVALFPRTLHAFRSGRRRVTLTVADDHGHEATKTLALSVARPETSGAAPDNTDESVAITAKETSSNSKPKAGSRRQESGLVVRGVVMALPGALNRRSFIIQTEKGPHEIYQNDAEFPELDLGDVVRAHGRVSKQKGLPRLLVDGRDDIVVESPGDEPLPEEGTVLSVNAVANGTLVSVRGEVVEKGNDAVVSDATGEIAVTRPAQGWPEGFVVGAAVRATGIIRETSKGKRIMPRSGDDLAVESAPAVALGTTKGARAPPGPWAGVAPIGGIIAAVLGVKEVRRQMQLRRIKKQNIIQSMELAETYGNVPTYRVQLNHADRGE